MSELMDRLEDVGELANKIGADGKITLPEAFSFFGEVIEAAAEIVHAMESRQDHFEEVVKDCQTFFDRHVVPLDMPHVPDWLERRVVKPFLRRSFRPAIEAIYDAIGGD